jgi:hypothetical protein
LSRKLERGTYELVDRRQRQRQRAGAEAFLAASVAVEILTGRDFNESGEAKDGAQTTKLLKEKQKEKLRLELELEFLDQSRRRGRGERSGRLWLYGMPAIKKREHQAGWLAWLAARATRTGTRAAARGEWMLWVD